MNSENSGQTGRAPAGLYRRILIRIGVTAVVLLLLLTLGVRICRLMLPFLAAWLVAWGLNRVAATLQKKGQYAHRWVTMLLAVLLLLFCIAFLSFLGWRVFNEAMALNSSWQSIFTALTDELEEYGAQLQLVSPEVQELMDQLIATIQAAVSSMVDSVSSSLLSLAGQQAVRIPAILLGVIVFIAAVFLICADYAGLSDRFRNLLDSHPDHPLHMIRHLVHAVFGEYLGKLLVLCVLVTIVDVAGLLLLQVQYAALLSLAMGVLTFLPYLGSGTLLLPWAVFCLLHAEFQRGLGLLLLYAAVTAARRLFSRRFLRRQTEFERFVNLICVFAGWKLWGWFGIFLGPAIMIALASLYHNVFFDAALADFSAAAQDLLRRMSARTQPEAAGQDAETAAGPETGEEPDGDSAAADAGRKEERS